MALSINIQVYGRLYTLTRGRVLQVDGILANKPYVGALNGVKIDYYGSALIFRTKFLQVHWDGYEHLDIYICNEYKNIVCGLCGNADGRNDY